MNNTLIENLNAMMEVKKDLNQVLRNNGIDGGPVFDTYPDKFRELFRLLEDTIGDIEEGPYANHETITNVTNPVITYKDNIVYITCATPGAQIYMRKDYEGWQQYILNFYITHDTYVESYAILNGVRSSTVSLLVPYQKTSFIDPPTIIRENSVVTITHQNENAAIWWRIYPTSYVRYTGPVNVSDTKTIVAYASYTGMASEEVWSEGTGSEITVEDPVLSCTDNYVSMACVTDGAIIYYKIYGSESWIQYTSPIEISVDTIFEAYAYKEGNISNTVTYTAEYEEPYVPPVVVPADPQFSISNNIVTITCSTSGATIYYREQGEINWIEYTGGITISEDTVFETYAELNGETSNTVSYSAVYQEEPQPITPADPVISCTNNVVTITCSTSGAVIWYSIDGGNTYNIYTEPITISVDTTFYAYSTKDGLTSNVVGPYEAEYEGTDYSILPLTFEILSNGKVGWKCDASDGKKTIQYRKNNGNWYNMTSTTSGVNINVSANDIIQFRGSNSTYYDDYGHYSYFTSTCDFNVSGNIMSLLNHNFSELTILSSNYTFNHLFDTCTHLLSASNLILPATTLTRSCYGSMFYRCENLITPPKLPATILAINCYTLMFKNCYSLQTAPKLSAITLTEECYSAMFDGCTSLTTAPTLPATTLARACYHLMFCGCTSLVNAPVLSATTLVAGCYWGMFENCTSLITAPSLPVTTLATGCYNLMFYGCTSLVNAPILPATTLVDGCYSSMFKNCSSLNYIKCMATDVSTGLYDWTNGVSSSGTFVKKTGVTWPTGTDGIPQNWTVQEASS